jgi:hypothetical protein
MYVNGLRQEVGAIERASCRRPSPKRPTPRQLTCRHRVRNAAATTSRWSSDARHGGFCNVCAHEWCDPAHATSTSSGRRSSPSPLRLVEDLIARTGIRRDELATLAEIGASTRSATIAAARCGRSNRRCARRGSCSSRNPEGPEVRPPEPGLPITRSRSPIPSPLRLHDAVGALMADYAGTSLTIGPHPVALRRMELALRGVLRASDLPHGRHGRRVRVAGAVITRQRPGTAKGFVFLTLEDETGIANIIVRPDLYSRAARGHRRRVVSARRRRRCRSRRASRRSKPSACVARRGAADRVA